MNTIYARNLTKSWLVWCPQLGIDEDNAREVLVRLAERWYIDGDLKVAVAQHALQNCPKGEYEVFVDEPRTEVVHKFNMVVK